MSQSLQMKSSAMAEACPGCGGRGLEGGWVQDAVPVMNTTLFYSPGQARDIARGTISLAQCVTCGLIFNRHFSPWDVHYGPFYEETQHYSERFSQFEASLAKELVERCLLQGKTICDIGCGKAEFLRLLCAGGQNRGIGLDPTVCPERIPRQDRAHLRLEPRYYIPGEPLTDIHLACLKMTLEHIAEPLHFLRGLRSSLMGSGCPLFIQVPNGEFVMEKGAFWDVYYEHCNYFSLRSLRSLAGRAGFVVERMWMVFGGQYICMLLHPSGLGEAVPAPVEGVVLRNFSSRVGLHLERWKSLADAFGRAGRAVFLWGGGSKAVAFISGMEGHSAIRGAIDINPHKQGTFLPGSGLPIHSPHVLKQHPDSLVIVMNPNYKGEVERLLKGGLSRLRIESLD